MAKVRRRLPLGSKKLKRSISKQTATPISDLSLPTEPSTPSTRIGDYLILLFGEKKIGKTDLTAQFDRTFHLMTEPGGKALAIHQRPVPRWSHFQGYVKLLEKDKGKNRHFDTVSVDTADLLYNQCSEHVCAQRGIDHPSDEGYGKGWSAVREEFTRWVLRLIATGKGIIFISHAAEKEIKMRGGETYDRISPTMAGQARDILEGLVDLWFYYGYSGRRRILTIQGSDHIGAGHRLKNNFRMPNGKPIVEIDMGSSAEEGYANLIAAFNNRYTPPREMEDEGGKKKSVRKLKLRR